MLTERDIHTLLYLISKERKNVKRQKKARPSEKAMTLVSLKDVEGRLEDMLKTFTPDQDPVTEVLKLKVRIGTTGNHDQVASEAYRALHERFTHVEVRRYGGELVKDDEHQSSLPDLSALPE